MHRYPLSAAEAITRLRTSATGLSHAEARQRRQEYGANSVAHVPDPPPWVPFRKECTHLFSLLLWVAAGMAFAAEWRPPGQGKRPGSRQPVLDKEKITVFNSPVTLSSPSARAPLDQMQDLPR